MKTGIIYKITLIGTSKCYIGCTTRDFHKRLLGHLNQHSNCLKLKEAFNEYGIESFSFDILEKDIPEQLLKAKELYYTELYNSVENGFNIKTVDDGFIKRTNLNNIDFQSVINEYKLGVPTNIIAEHFKISQTSVYNILHRSNEQINYCKNNRFNNSAAKIDFDLLVQMKRNGKQTKEIAEYFGVNKSSVKRMVKRHKDIIFPRVSDNLTDNAEVENLF